MIISLVKLELLVCFQLVVFNKVHLHQRRRVKRLGRTEIWNINGFEVTKMTTHSKILSSKTQEGTLENITCTAETEKSQEGKNGSIGKFGRAKHSKEHTKNITRTNGNTWKPKKKLSSETNLWLWHWTPRDQCWARKVCPWHISLHPHFGCQNGSENSRQVWNIARIISG